MATASQPAADTGTDEWIDDQEFPDLDARLDHEEAQWANDHPEEAETTPADQLAEVLREPHKPESEEEEQAPDPQGAQSTNQTGNREANPEKPGDSPDQQQQQEQQDDAAKSKYQKARERQDRSWEALNKEKAELAAQRKRHQEERETWEATVRRQASEAPTKPASTTEQYSPEQLEDAAKKWEQSGRFDLADLARAEARRVKEEQAKGQAQTQQPTTAPAAGDPVAQVRLQADHNRSWQQVRQEAPEFFQADHPLHGEMQAFIQQNPDVFQHGRGPILAARHLKLKFDLGESQKVASRVPELEKENATLKARVQELEAATSLGDPGGAQGPLSEKSFHEMTVEEQERELMASLRRG